MKQIYIRYLPFWNLIQNPKIQIPTLLIIWFIRGNMYLYFNQKEYQKINILNVIIIISFSIIIVSFNCQSSPAD